MSKLSIDPERESVRSSSSLKYRWFGPGIGVGREVKLLVVSGESAETKAILQTRSWDGEAFRARRRPEVKAL